MSDQETTVYGTELGDRHTSFRLSLLPAFALPLALIACACTSAQSEGAIKMSESNPRTAAGTSDFSPEKMGFRRLQAFELFDSIAGITLSAASIGTQGVSDSSMSFQVDGRWSESKMSLVSELTRGRWSIADDKLCMIPDDRDVRCGFIWANLKKKQLVIEYEEAKTADRFKLYSVTK
ncbi:hypothetical protein ACVWZA_001872 [Sphingomonas sp. UYAg733]